MDTGSAVFGFALAILVFGMPLSMVAIFQSSDKHDWQKRYYALCDDAGATVVAHYGKTEECSLHKVEAAKP